MTNNLPDSLRQAGYAFNETQINRFQAYFQLLSHWNKRINLTAIKQQDYFSHHLVDCLSVLEHIHGERIMDMGTGAGLPGVVLAIALPQRNFTLVDARNKKIQFLNSVKNALPLKNITPVHCRVEQFPASANFSTVVTRAFSQLVEIYRLAQPLLAANGRIVAMKGRLQQEELNQLDHIGVHYEVKSVQVHGLDAQRQLVIIESI